LGKGNYGGLKCQKEKTKWNRQDRGGQEGEKTDNIVSRWGKSVGRAPRTVRKRGLNLGARGEQRENHSLKFELFRKVPLQDQIKILGWGSKAGNRMGKRKKKKNKNGWKVCKGKLTIHVLEE